MTLKELRKQNKLTQKQCADYLGIPLRTYQNYENDERKSTSMKYLYMLEKMEELEENKITIETIRNAVLNIVDSYPIKRVTLFGSRAAGTNRDDSDVDLIIEFTEPVTLLTLSNIKFCLEEILGIDVDIVHGPIRKTDMIEIGKETELYAA